jgi:hypothetical protein
MNGIKTYVCRTGPISLQFARRQNSILPTKSFSRQIITVPADNTSRISTTIASLLTSESILSDRLTTFEYAAYCSPFLSCCPN